MHVTNEAPHHLKPLRLHELIGSHAAWTDELWDATLQYLLERVGTDDAIRMGSLLERLTDHTESHSPHKIDYLRRFSGYPPTVLLGIFDLVRQQTGR